MLFSVKQRHLDEHESICEKLRICLFFNNCQFIVPDSYPGKGDPNHCGSGSRSGPETLIFLIPTDLDRHRPKVSFGSSQLDSFVDTKKQVFLRVSAHSSIIMH